MNARNLGYCLLALVLGLAIALYTLNHDAAFKKYVEQRIKIVFKNSFESTLNGNLESLNIFSGELIFHDVLVTSLEDKDWYWKSETFIIQFSWLSFFAKGKFNLTVFLESIDAFTQLKGTHIAIIDHLKSFITGAAGFPARLHILSIAQGTFNLVDTVNNITLSSLFNGYYANLDGWIRVHCNADNAAIKKNDEVHCTDLQARFSLSAPNAQEGIMHATINGRATLPGLNEKNRCSFEAQWNNTTGQLYIHNTDHSFVITIYDVIKHKDFLTAHAASTIPLQFLDSIVPSLKKISLEGTAHANAQLSWGSTCDLETTIALNDIKIAEITLGSCMLQSSRKNEIWHGSVTHNSNNSFPLIDASFNYNEKEDRGEIDIINSSTIAQNALKILPSNFALKCQKNKNSITGSYNCTIDSSIHNQKYILNGSLNTENADTTFDGSFNKKKYHAVIQNDPTIYLKSFELTHELKELFTLCTNRKDWLDGVFDISYIKELIHHFCGFTIVGEGQVVTRTLLQDKKIITHFELNNGNIRIPETYTIISGIKGVIEFDLGTLKAVITDLKINLGKGSLESKRALIQFNKQGIPEFIYAPCILKKAFLMVQKELFAVFSGNLIWNYNKNKGSDLQGCIIIDRGYLKKNIFSHSPSAGFGFDWNLYNVSNNCILNLTFETKKPIEVKTSFLQTNIHLNGSAQGTLQNPEFSGSLMLENGSLGFPYKPMSITHGSIYFLPHQLHDPVVELVAKGKIRKYHITLRCNGSLQHPQISFESTPPLTQEQIITLLLAGSQEGSLSLAMPALIMQKVQNLIFGPEQSASRLESYFKGLLEPLKHIRFIPGFSDQSGRGGFRGSIEIDVNEQLHALIQKNFSLSEDTKIEVEYFLSDDVTVRGIRDERGDYGGEVEMRWKF